MMLHRSLLAFVAVLIAAPTLHAQAVQLPTFHQFGVSTSVLVPDRGAAYLGGVNRAAYGSVSRGPIPQRARGQEISSAGVQVRATIIDHAELDAAALADGERRAAQRAAAAPLPHDPIAARAAYLTEQLARTDDLRRPGGAAPDAVATIPPAAPPARVETPHDLALRDYAAGRAAEQAGKGNVARIYYEMASKRASGALLDEIAARLAAVRGEAPRVASQR